MKKITAILFTFALAIATAGFALACNDKPQNKPIDAEYTVTLDYNYSGAPQPVTQKVKHGAKLQSVANPTRTGYTFIGWYNGAVRFDIAQNEITSDLLLLARWNNAPAVQEDSLIFENADGVKYVFEHGETPTGIKIGETVSFSVEKSPYYKGEAQVFANETELIGVKNANDLRKVYTVTVQEYTVISVRGVTADSDFLGGMGTVENPYKIGSEAQWLLFADMLNAQSGSINSRNFTLTADLDFCGYTIPSIRHFSGNLNGNGHTISNFEVVVHGNVNNPENPSSITDTVNAGLFGRIANAEISNLNINGKATVAGNSIMCVGLLGGDIASSTITNVNVSGEADYVNTNAYYTSIGGLAGIIRGIDAYGPTVVRNCTSSVTVNANFIAYSGGFAGRMSGSGEAAVTVVNCVSTGDVTGGHYAGGFASFVSEYVSIANSYCTGSVVAETTSENGTSAAGGFVGYLSVYEAVLQNCFTASSYAAYAPVRANAQSGDIYGITGSEYSDDLADLNKTLVYKTYRAQGGKVNYLGTDYDLKTQSGVNSLLAWNVAKWNFEQGEYPVPAEFTDNDITFTVEFNGKKITQGSKEYGNYAEAQDGVSFTVKYGTALMSAAESGKVALGTGMLIAAADGDYSCGYCGDGEAALPAAFAITDNDDAPAIKLKFVSYGEINGTYGFVYGGVNYDLVLDGPLNSRIESGALAYGLSCVYYGGGRLVVASLPEFINTASPVTASADGETVTLGDITASKRTGSEVSFEGEYFTDIYSFNSVAFSGSQVTLNEYGSTESGSYTVTDGVAEAQIGGETYYFEFDANGYLCRFNAQQAFDGTVYARGIPSGIWRDEIGGLTITLLGETRYGYGHATDGDGNEYTYKQTAKYILTFYSGERAVFAAQYSQGDWLVEVNGDIRRATLYNPLSGEWYGNGEMLVIDNSSVAVGSEYGVDFEYIGENAIAYARGGVNYLAVMDGDALTVTDLSEQESFVYKRYDAFYGAFVNGSGSVKFDFNGLGDRGEGVVVITENGVKSQYEYTVNSNGSIAAVGDNYGVASFASSGLLRVTPAGGESYNLGVENEFGGVWSIQQNPFKRVKVGLLNRQLSGSGTVQWEVDNMPTEENARITYSNGALSVRFTATTPDGTVSDEFLMTVQDGVMRLIWQDKNLPMAHSDAAWGFWEADGRMFIFDGIGLALDGYRGLINYTENYSAGANAYRDAMVYSREIVNDEYVNRIYAVSDGYLVDFATFDIFIEPSVQFLEEYRAKLYESGIAYTEYTNFYNRNNFMFIKPTGSVMGTASVYGEDGRRVAAFSAPVTRLIANGKYSGGTLDFRGSSSYDYTAEYISEDGNTAILSLYGAGAQGVSGNLEYMAVLKKNENGEWVISMTEYTASASFPQNLFADAA